MSRLIMLVGIPGSGKSTVAKDLQKEYGGLIFSSDQMREILFEDVNFQGDNALVFTRLHQAIIQQLKTGGTAIYDATNLSMKRRIAFLRQIESINCFKSVVVVLAPYELCMERNKARERTVPDNVIINMVKQFQFPYYYEGWDLVELRYTSDLRYDGHSLVQNLRQVDHDNPNHSLTIGDHCIGAGRYLEQKEQIRSVVYEAALYHDIGKKETKGYVNSKGEPSEIAHYYSHQNFGAYKSAFIRGMFHEQAFVLYRAILIQWHMEPYLRVGNAWDKFVKIIGDDIAREVLTIHEADKAAH